MVIYFQFELAFLSKIILNDSQIPKWVLAMKTHGVNEAVHPSVTGPMCGDFLAPVNGGKILQQNAKIHIAKNGYWKSSGYNGKFGRFYTFTVFGNTKAVSRRTQRVGKWPLYFAYECVPFFPFYTPRTCAAGSCDGKTRGNLGVWITKNFRDDLQILQMLVFQPIATKNVYCYFWCIKSGKKNLNFSAIPDLSFFDPGLCKKSTFLRVSKKRAFSGGCYIVVNSTENGG